MRNPAILSTGVASVKLRRFADPQTRKARLVFDVRDPDRRVIEHGLDRFSGRRRALGCLRARARTRPRSSGDAYARARAPASPRSGAFRLVATAPGEGPPPASDASADSLPMGGRGDLPDAT